MKNDKDKNRIEPEKNKSGVNVNPVAKQQVTEEKIKKGKVGGIKPEGSGRKGSVSRQDGGYDTGSSAGAH
ncbi:MAG: hypothetical protein LPK19_12585 [Hymenobacteraceae bacterium]|nr:hypothetical protein [Hymenobacteraceae bacterium]MDX5397069.1 hypothetical protein [Hymenobacteraceae bacterium]MDX5513139.1 hypothetical protein [Hymenobacteraceae bacterium]